ncbi:MAG: DUF1467 family protein [Pseudomonadota bacterium]
MDTLGGVVIFFIAWWMCFLAVLPIGVRGQWEDDNVVEGSEEGAPQNPMLKKKLIWATLGAIIVTLLINFIILPWLAGPYSPFPTPS